LSVVRYTDLRPFVVACNTTDGSLDHLKPPKLKRRGKRSSDAPVGGGAGPASS
jgi:hypothetical protein